MSIRNTIILSSLMLSQFAFTFNNEIDPFAGQENFIPLETSSRIGLATKRPRPNFSKAKLTAPPTKLVKPDIPPTPTKLVELEIELVGAEVKNVKLEVQNHDLRMEISRLKQLISVLKEDKESLLNTLNKANNAADEYFESNRINREELSELHRTRSVLRDDCKKFCWENKQMRAEISLLKTDLLKLANCQPEEGEIHEIYERKYRSDDYLKYCKHNES